MNLAVIGDLAVFIKEGWTLLDSGKSSKLPEYIRKPCMKYFCWEKREQNHQ